MSFLTGYLTSRETTVWDLRRKNRTQAEIGRLLGVSRQASHSALEIIDTKIERAFSETAVSNSLEVRSINLVDGIMEAYSPIHKTPVFASLSMVNGLKVWYMHEGNCGSCSEENSCRRYLKTEAAERGIELTREDWSLPPTQLAVKIFGRYIGDNKYV